MQRHFCMKMSVGERYGSNRFNPKSAHPNLKHLRIFDGEDNVEK